MQRNEFGLPSIVLPTIAPFSTRYVAVPLRCVQPLSVLPSKIGVYLSFAKPVRAKANNRAVVRMWTCANSPRATHSSTRHGQSLSTKPTVPTTTSHRYQDSSIFRGGIPASTTPANADHTPNTAGLGKSQDLIAAGMNAVHCGSKGDWPLLTDDQRQSGVTALTEAGVPVIVGTVVNTRTAVLMLSTRSR